MKPNANLEALDRANKQIESSFKSLEKALKDAAQAAVAWRVEATAQKQLADLGIIDADEFKKITEALCAGPGGAVSTAPFEEVYADSQMVIDRTTETILKLRALYNALTADPETKATTGFNPGGEF